MLRLVGVGAVWIVLALPAHVVTGQSSGNTSKSITFQGRTWACDESVRAAEVEYRGKRALHVNISSSGTMFVAGTGFRNGVIEVDLAAPGRGIPGIGFRGLSDGEWRNRIFFQRMPRGERQNEEVLDQAVVTCRKGTNIVLTTHFSRTLSDGLLNWFHVRLVVRGDSVTIFLEGENEPIMTLGTVLEDGQGAIGLCGSDYYVSNVEFTDES